MEFQVVESLEKKEIRSKDFNCVFNKETNTFAIWGSTPEETPLWCPFTYAMLGFRADCRQQDKKT